MANLQEQIQDAGSGLDPNTSAELNQLASLRMAQQVGGSANDRQALFNILNGVAGASIPAQQQRMATLAAQQALTQMEPQGDDESDMRYQMRLIRTQRDAAAKYSPEMAASLNTQLLKLRAAEIEQQSLVDQNSRQNEEEADRHAQNQLVQGAEQAEAASGANYYLVGPDNRLIGRYDMYQANERQALAADKSSNPQARLYNQADYDKYVSTLQEIAERAKEAAAARAQMRAQLGIAPGSEGMLAAQYATGFAGRMTAPERAVAINTLQDRGVTLADQAAARADIAALQSGARAIGQRQANLAVIEQSLGPLGDKATGAIAALNPSQLRILNAALNFGRMHVNDPLVYRALTATQSLRTEYARLMRGGAMPDDHAMEEAKKLIPDNVTAAVMGKITDQIRNGEVPALEEGSNLALDAYVNPGKWRGLIALSSKLGIAVDDLAGPGAGGAPANGQAAASAAGGAAPPKTLVFDPTSGTFK